MEICVWGNATYSTLGCPDGLFTENVYIYDRGISLYPAERWEEDDEGVPQYVGTAQICVQGAGAVTSPVFDFDQALDSDVSNFVRVNSTGGGEAFKLYMSNVDLYNVGSISSQGRPTSAWTNLVVQVGPNSLFTTKFVSIDEADIGIRATDDAAIELRWSDIVRMRDIGAILEDDSTSVMSFVDMSSNGMVAEVFDDHVGVWEHNAIYDNDDGIRIRDAAAVDMHNHLAHSNNPTGQMPLIEVLHEATLTVSNSTFAENATWAQIAWYHDTTVDVTDTLFYDDKVPALGGTGTAYDAALYCGYGLSTTGGATASYVHDFRFDYPYSPMPPSTKWGLPGSGAPCVKSNTTSGDPYIISSSGYDYYLNPTHPSPLIDAGSGLANVLYNFADGDWTTDPSGTLDSSTVDIGYHYPW